MPILEAVIAVGLAIGTWIADHGEEIGRWFAIAIKGVTNIKRWANFTDQEMEVWKYDHSEMTKKDHQRIPAGQSSGGDMWIPWANNADEYNRGGRAIIQIGGQPIAYIWQQGEYVRFNTKDEFVDAGQVIPGAGGAGGDRTLVVVATPSGRCGIAMATGKDPVSDPRPIPDFASPDVIPPADKVQRDWRFCVKCNVLFWTGGPEQGGSCSAGDQHNAAGSSLYTLRRDDPAAPGHTDWRFCKKCNSLFWTGGPDQGGTCPHGGAHDGTSSSHYTVVKDDPNAKGQKYWRFCAKCNSLFWTGSDTIKAGGRCKAGGVHNGSNSSNYTLTVTK